MKQNLTRLGKPSNEQFFKPLETEALKQKQTNVNGVLDQTESAALIGGTG